MKIEIYLIKKYLLSKRKKTFSFITIIIGITGITLGVSALIISLGITNGFHTEIKNRLLSLTPHIILFGTSTEELLRKNYIIAASPFVYEQIVIKSKNKVCGAVIKGINYETEIKVTDLDKRVKIGKFQHDTLLIGDELAKNLNVGVGDKVILILPTITLPEKELFHIPPMSEFKIGGIFKTGLYEQDSTLIFADIKKIKNVFPGFSRYCIGIKTKNPYKVEKYLRDLKKEIKLSNVISWKELNQNLFAALKLERIITFVITALIIVVACFSICSNLFLFTYERIREIGILSAIGLERRNISKLFFFFGTIIGTTGIAIGTILGFFISFLINKYEFIKLPPEIYFITKVPVHISLVDVSLILLLTISLTLISSIYPAYKVSKLNPVEIIRHE